MKNKIKVPREIIIASHNQGKVKEINILLNDIGIKASPISDYSQVEPIENGKSFKENALIKARNAVNLSKITSLADDSGLCVEALNGDPGIYSARWAGKERNFNLAMSKINDSIKKVENPNYKCFFVCALSLSWPNGDNVTVTGKIDGKFSWPPKGNFGFGYDPIFKPLGYDETFGEMDPEFKHSISHRALAFKKLKSLCFPSLEN